MTTLRILLTALVFCTLLAICVESCGFPMMGGGGCCCGGGGGGGCCGRKKRSVIEQQFRTEETDPCPQSAWKPVIEKAIGKDLQSSKFAVQGALFKAYDSKFFVACANNEDRHHLNFVTNGEGYCTAGNAQFYCAAVVLQA